MHLQLDTSAVSLTDFDNETRKHTPHPASLPRGEEAFVKRA